MGNHVRVVGILWIVWSSMGILAGLFVLTFFGTIGIAAGTDDPRAFPIIAGIGMAVFTFVAILSLPGLLAGWGLLKYRPWARILAIILSFLKLLVFPLGTALGIYSIWVLFHDKTRRLFEAQMMPPEPQASPETS
jgi:hypothetical protein